MRQVKAIIERAGDGTYSIYSDADDLSYLITGTGKTVEEAKKCFEDGYADMKRYYKEEGKEFTEVEMCYCYDMASFLAYYSKVLSLAGLSRLTGVNPQQLSHYVTGRRPSVAQDRKEDYGRNPRFRRGFKHSGIYINFVWVFIVY